MELIEIKEYLWAWLAYLAGCSVLLAIGWQWTRNFPFRTVKYMLRLGVAAALLTPVSHENAAMLKVPAIAVGMLGWLTGDPEAAVSALVALALSVTVALILAVALALLEHRLPPWLQPPGDAERPAKVAGRSARAGDRVEPSVGGNTDGADGPTPS